MTASETVVDASQFRDRSLYELLGQLAAKIPAPGGGVTAALHGAQAAALLAMVARYSTGERFADHTALVNRCIANADMRRLQCLQLAGEDEAAFSAVSEAYRLPKSSADEKQVRSAAIAVALAGAAAPPAAVIGNAQQLMAIAEALLPICNKNVITDVAAATDAARAAATTARLNVEINLGGIRDTTVRDRMLEALTSVEDIMQRADRVTESVRAQLV